MTDNLVAKLKHLIKESNLIFEKRLNKHLFSKSIKSEANIFCYHYQIPDVILYKDENFERRECYYINPNSGKNDKYSNRNFSLNNCDSNKMNYQN